MATDDGAFVSAPLTLDAGALITHLKDLTKPAAFYRQRV